MTHIVTRLTYPAYSTGAAQVDKISLPAPPFAIPETDRSETAPNARTIRGDADWRRDDVLRSAAMIKT